MFRSSCGRLSPRKTPFCSSFLSRRCFVENQVPPFREFVDSAGRKWRIEWSIASMRRAQGARLFDIAAISDSFDKAFNELRNPLNTIDIGWALVADQAAKAAVSREEWESASESRLSLLQAAILLSATDFFLRSDPFLRLTESSLEMLKNLEDTLGRMPGTTGPSSLPES